MYAKEYKFHPPANRQLSASETLPPYSNIEGKVRAELIDNRMVMRVSITS